MKLPKILKACRVDKPGRFRLADCDPAETFGLDPSHDDVKAMLSPRAKKLAGAIAGRALYDGRLDPAAALALIKTARAPA